MEKENQSKQKKFFKLPSNSCSETYTSKVKKIIHYLKRKKAEFLFITASENNAWLMNIRGHDTKYTPIPLSYILMDKNKKIYFFCNLNKISISLRRIFNEIKFLDINSVSKILEGIKNKKFIIDKNSCSNYFENLILKNNKILNYEDPIYALKAIKGKREIENIKKSSYF